MASLFVVFLLFQIFAPDNVFSENQIEDLLNLLNKVQDGYSFKNEYEPNWNDLTLCQKHSKIYIDERNNLTGWAFRSKESE